MIERRGAELRAAPGRRVIGNAMAYGTEARARLPDGRVVRERFAAFAFDQYLRSGSPTLLNLQHDRTLTVASTGATAGRGDPGAARHSRSVAHGGDAAGG